MNYNLTLKSEAAFLKLAVNLNSLWIAIAAFGCAYLVEATAIDYTYPLQILLEGAVTNADVITDISTK